MHLEPHMGSHRNIEVELTKLAMRATSPLNLIHEVKGIS
jgi:hypothetical protein